MTSLYQELVANGCEVSGHYSDLYVKQTQKAVDICTKHKASVSRFVSQIDGAIWLDIPFGYDPYWEKKQTENKS